MNSAVVAIQKEIDAMESLIQFYNDRGNPSVELVIDWKKLHDLKNALTIIEKYGFMSENMPSCNLGVISSA